MRVETKLMPRTVISNLTLAGWQQAVCNAKAITSHEDLLVYQKKYNRGVRSDSDTSTIIGKKPSKMQIRALREEVGFKIAIWRRNENFSAATAGYILRSHRARHGQPPKQSWDIPYSERHVLGLIPRHNRELFNCFCEEIEKMMFSHIDVNGYFIVPHPKEKTPKLIPMLDEDIQLYREYPVGLPDLYFFRHDRANGGAKIGDQFSPHLMYDLWKKACQNLGVEGVDLCGGTRHSTTSALGEHFTIEELKSDGTMHKTNKAFERYFQSHRNKTTAVYTKIREIQKGKVLKLKNADDPDSVPE